MPAGEIRTLEEHRRFALQEHAAGASGLATARRLSEAVDAAAGGLWRRLTGEGRPALVAVGEYGRRELGPGSPIEILVLHPPGTSAAEEAASLLRELWGAGLEVEAPALTPGAALELASADFDREAAFLDARLVAGDAMLFDEWMRSLLERVRSSPGEFLERLRRATQARRLESEDATASLEPNLRDGRGGLADLAALGLMEAACGPQVIPERGDLPGAADYLHRVRNELHRATGRNADVLQLHDQEEVAQTLLGGGSDPAPEILLMRSLYRCCRAIAFALDSTLFPETKDPEPAIRFAERIGEGGGGRWPVEAREAFLEVLSAGAGGRPALRWLEQRGMLVAAIPEWEGIRCLPQRSVYHRLSVDAHSFEVVARLAELDRSAEELVRRAAGEAAADRAILLLAGLLHDIGKGALEDHSVRGERLARAAVDRMGLDAADATEVVWLVRNHLALSDAATRRDIGDERLVVGMADRIGSERRLRLLYLLSVADAQATGPAAWTMWRATLVARLFSRIGLVLERGELVGQDATRLARVRAEQIREALAGLPASAVETHLTGMPRAWLLSSQPPDALIEQSSRMIHFDRRDELRIHATPRADAGIWEVVVVAVDRPGLLGKISGALALHGLNVLGAEAFTREDGLALEVFRVEALGDEEGRFEHVTEDARRALRGRLSLDARLAEKRELAARPSTRIRKPPRVVVDNRASDFSTVVEVHATDRIGLLSTIARALAELELDVRLAKVSTYGDDVVDVFYVRDLDGQKVTDPEYVFEVERTILHRLGA